MKRLLMCEPTGYDVNYVINPYMKNSVVDGALALRQWRSVKDALVDAGAEVVTVEGDARYPDMVFAANAAQVASAYHFNAAIIAKFRSSHRAGEAAIWAQRLLAVGRIDTIIGFNSAYSDGPYASYFEGQGDVVTLPSSTKGDEGIHELKHYIIGYGQRTSSDGARLASVWLQKLNAHTTTTVQLKSGYFYHLDTCLFAGTKGAVVIPEAFEKYSYERLLKQLSFEDNGVRIVRVSPEDGKTLCCNMVEAAPGVVVSGLLPDKVRGELKSIGYSCIEVDTSEFLKSGGSVRCMTLDL